MISLGEAHKIIAAIPCLAPEKTPLDSALGLRCSQDMYSVVNCPTVDSSLKDGFAVVAEDIVRATSQNPVELNVTATVTAGDKVTDLHVGSGEAVRIMTGARIPAGASSVVASEFTSCSGTNVTIFADAHKGRNILSKGSDICKGDLVLGKGSLLEPARLGLLASAGVGEVSCYPVPKVAVAATGSELVWPGEKVGEGKVAASNMVTAQAEFSRLGCKVSTTLLRDDLEALEEQLSELSKSVDLLITCGGVLDGDKDLTMRAMERVRMEKMFHRVRIGPGKGACLGRVGGTIVCNLPGGPPSNHVGLILLALPVCRRLMGYEDCFPVKRKVVLEQAITGQRGWTQLFYSKVKLGDGELVASSLRKLGRMQTLGHANTLVELPESEAGVHAGKQASAWIYNLQELL